ncbi:MAG: biotin--[acetyl-CoA-carboxylase] ligase [Bacteroidota bacterium]|nr:biotin--[acetyl-CoA-carboxylase] ligase [Bacteroidota bacterium]
MNHSRNVPGLIKLDRTRSTNDYAIELLLKKDVLDGTIIWALEQTKGKGEGDNKWESEAGKNLTATIIFRPSFLLPVNQFSLLQIVALGVYDYLKTYIDDVFIKWPNDLYVGGNKIAGILIENSIIGEEINYSIAGIGININQIKFPSSLENPISMKMLTSKHYELEESLSLLNQHIGNNYQFLKERKYKEINSRYQSVLYKLEKLSAFHFQGKMIRGKIKGVSDTGELLLELESGEIQSFGFKELVYE